MSLVVIFRKEQVANLGFITSRYRGCSPLARSAGPVRGTRGILGG